MPSVAPGGGGRPAIELRATDGGPVLFSADVAQQRQQQFRKLPGLVPHESASLSVGPITLP